MIKILFFIDDLTGGGAEKVLRTLVNNMDQRKFSITVHTQNAADPSEYLAPGIRYRAINCCKTDLGRKLFSYWIRLCAELKWLYPLYIKDDYDIEVAYLECGPTKFLAGSTNKKAKKIAWVHCDLEKKEGMAQQVEELKKYYKNYDRVICVSQNVKDSFEKLLGSGIKSQVLYNVVDDREIKKKADAFSVSRKCEMELLSVGRLTWQKGFDRLLDACAKLKEQGYLFHLHILGEGPERENLEKLIIQNHLDNYVELMGFQENPYPYIKAADLVVCSSRYEGLSTVVTEALILEKTVVTTSCTGMEELLGASEYGLITQDSTEGIYLGMKQLLDHPELRDSYEAAAAARGNAFSKDRILRQTEDFFAELVT